MGALEREEHTAIRRHLAACAACSADYADLLPVRDWLAHSKRHVAACRACRAEYPDLLHLRLADSAAAEPRPGH
jgi:hypothetical protein